MKRVNQTSFYSELLNVYAYLRTQAGNVADQLEKPAMKSSVLPEQLPPIARNWIR